MEYSLLYLLGNGFDRAHGMPTGYGDFRRWLLQNNRFDFIHELQSAYPARIKDDYLLWSQFEKALGEYDLDTVINWSWENLYLTVDSLGNQLFNNSFIDTQLPDIIDEAFTKWVRSIKMPTAKAYDCIEKLIVGHNREINPGDYWDDGIDMRENNERMQRLTDMNTLCKPVYEIIERNDWFFKRLNSVKDIHIIGHSCETVDYPYFRKVKESVNTDALWHFNPHSDDDKVREKKFIEEIRIDNYVVNV